jgi:hypothetical protein
MYSATISNLFDTWWAVFLLIWRWWIHRWWKDWLQREKMQWYDFLENCFCCHRAAISRCWHNSIYLWSYPNYSSDTRMRFGYMNECQWNFAYGCPFSLFHWCYMTQLHTEIHIFNTYNIMRRENTIITYFERW